MADIEKEAVYEVPQSTTAEEATKASVADAAKRILDRKLDTAPWVFAASPESSHEGHATSVAMPGWTQQLKGQTVVENAIEGRAGNAEKMEMQHHRLMDKLEHQAQEDAKAQQTSGAFNNMSMMHQYMGQDGSSFLLMTDAGKGEPVMTSGEMPGTACPPSRTTCR